MLANCLTYCSKDIIDAMAAFPKKRHHVIKALAEVFHYDDICKQQGMMHQERLSYHQAQSGLVMQELKAWLQTRLDQSQAEPNSSLGKAVNHMP